MPSPAAEIEVEVAPSEDPAPIVELLERCPTSFAQQTPAWRDVIEAVGQDQGVFLVARRGGETLGLLPAYRFEGPCGAILTSCAQAGPLGGVACTPGQDPDPIYEALLGAFVERARKLDCAVATVITNPFWPDRERCVRWFAPEFVLENQCQALDLERVMDEDGELVESSTKLRRNLRIAAKGALRIDEDQTPENLAGWYAIHSERHTAIGAEPLPWQLFEAALRIAVPAGKARFFFVRMVDSGELVAGGLYLLHGTVMDLLMASGDTASLQHRTTYALAIHAMRFARRRGIRWFNWQGSPPGSGVYEYKKGWGSEEIPYAYLTRVTGDVAPILASTPERIRSAYRWHYVLPFDRLGRELADAVGESHRAEAWRAGGDDPG